MSLKEITLYTDGACSGNPGAGGWGAVLIYNGAQKELSGYEAQTTNNRMELTAAIRGLEALKEPCCVKLYTDSQYLVNAFQKGWLENWKRKNYRKADGKPVLNPELWQRLDELFSLHQVTLYWVKGHADNPYNNRCDELAVGEYQKHRNSR